VNLDSYENTGVVVAMELVNALAPGVEERAAASPRSAIAEILAVDPPSVAQLQDRDAPRFVELARSLRPVFQELDGRDLDGAAARLNALLARHPAHPHLAKEHGRWRLHHHPMDVALVPMWTSICAEAVARMLGEGHGERFGICEAADCARVFFDVSKNASRRFCSTACQNRVKAAAFRRRQKAPPRRPTRRTRG
jgi:predicted RNA-binding Zn ribbon-like protein